MLQQYNDGSPKKPRVLILAPTGVAGINLNGTTVYSALGLPCGGKLFPSDSNTLASLRNKYAEAEVIILDEILMVSKKRFYLIHRHLIEVFNLSNLPFAVRSVLFSRRLSSSSTSPCNAIVYKKLR